MQESPYVHIFKEINLVHTDFQGCSISSYFVMGLILRSLHTTARPAQKVHGLIYSYMTLIFLAVKMPIEKLFPSLINFPSVCQRRYKPSSSLNGYEK